MKLFEPVIVYTHEQRDYHHSTNDSFAIVLKDRENGSVDVVIFPPGGPTRYETLREFNEDVVSAGGTFWRDNGSAPPDFTGLDYVSTQEWTVLNNRHRDELTKVEHHKREELIVKHREERKTLLVELGKKYPHEGVKPVPTQPVPGQPDGRFDPTWRDNPNA